MQILLVLLSLTCSLVIADTDVSSIHIELTDFRSFLKLKPTDTPNSAQPILGPGKQRSDQKYETVFLDGGVEIAALNDGKISAIRITSKAAVESLTKMGLGGEWTKLYGLNSNEVRNIFGKPLIDHPYLMYVFKQPDNTNGQLIFDCPIPPIPCTRFIVGWDRPNPAAVPNKPATPTVSTQPATPANTSKPTASKRPPGDEKTAKNIVMEAFRSTAKTWQTDYVDVVHSGLERTLIKEKVAKLLFQNKPEAMTHFIQGIQSMSAKNWSNAKIEFQKASKALPEDPTITYAHLMTELADCSIDTGCLDTLKEVKTFNEKKIVDAGGWDAESKKLTLDSVSMGKVILKKISCAAAREITRQAFRQDRIPAAYFYTEWDRTLCADFDSYIRCALIAVNAKDVRTERDCIVSARALASPAQIPGIEWFEADMYQ